MNYYIFQHGSAGGDTEVVKCAYDNLYALCQYEYRKDESEDEKEAFQCTSTVTSRWNVLSNIKIGDIIFISKGKQKYAWGYAIKPRFNNKELELTTLKCSDMMSEPKHKGYYYRSGNYDGYIKFEDCECFYENLKYYEDDKEYWGQGAWGQRIDVDEWRSFIDEGVSCDINTNRNTPIMSIKKQQALEIVRKLTGNENFKFEDEPMKNTSTEKYIELLKKSKNIIFTGAPGTGKTYMAKEIAMKMILKTLKKNKDLTQEEKEKLKECSNFVQFHPSYDYTDFVEGLRPVKNDDDKNIGFERKDGIFKEFCKRALKNIKDSEKDIETITYESIMREKLVNFVDEIIIVINEKTELAKEFSIVGLSGREAAPIIYINNESDEIIFDVKTKNNHTFRIKTNINELIRQYKEFLKKTPTEWALKSFRDKVLKKGSKGYHTYYYGFLKAFYDKYDAEINNSLKGATGTKIKKMDYVFIIDEINRGEISKIFGELFYSIDPGYRGEKGKTKTQYSNLIEDEDDKEFYVPENVYIIGTMNDIDRSVESMDFAIRRRFAWVEIKASEQTGMWDGQIDDCKYEAEKRMNKLNKAIIEEIEGLSSGYHIGPSYFLKLKDYEGDFDDLWNYHIYGVLFEYLRGMPDTKNTMGKLQAAYNLTKYEEDNNTDNDDLNNSEDSQ